MSPAEAPSAQLPSAGLPAVEFAGLEFAGLAAQQAVLGPAIAERMQAVLRHGQYIMGPEVVELGETDFQIRCTLQSVLRAL